MSLITYIKETRGELKHVTWPSRGQAFLYTGMVIIVSIAVSIYLGIFDFLFKILIEKIVS